MTKPSNNKKKRPAASSSSSSPQHTNKKQKATTQQTKRAVKQERQSQRRHADIVVQGKIIWNQLRQKSNSKQQIADYMQQLLTLLPPDTILCEVALQHDASRVVQAMIQFASTDQRLLICKALSQQLAEMAKDQYAHFCVLKLIQYGHKEPACVSLILKSLKGHVCKLAVHAVGARIMELLFTTLSNTQFAQLKLEFYGPHVSLFSSDTNIASVTLQTCLKQHPDHETTIKEFLFTHVLQKCMDKNLYGMAFVQQLLWEYSQCLPDLQTMWIPNLVDHALQLISTRPGAHVVSQCAAYGTAKDRKRLLKAFKGYVRSSLLHKHAHLPILQLVLSTDDTVSVGKSLMAELLVMPNKKISVDDDLNKEDEEVSPLLDLALDEHASKLFLLLLHNSPDEQRKCLDPLDQVELNPQIDGAPTSKKNVDTRRLECLQPLREALIELCRQHAAQLLAVPTGSRVLERAVLTWPQDLIDALAKACRDEALWDHAVGHLAIKHLLQVSSDFARAVVLPSEILSSRAAFCVASWVEHQPAKDSIQQIKAPQIEKAMKEAKKHGQATAGFEALLKVVNSGGKRETEKSKKTKQ